MTPRSRVKICCIQSTAEIDLCVAHGVDAVGLVGAMPSGPGPLPEAALCDLAAHVPAGVDSFLLTSSRSAPTIIGQQRRTRASVLQLVDRPEPGTHHTLRAALPGIRLVQVVHVHDRGAVDEAIDLAAGADALLLDSGNPDARELGGTGRRHDWRLSRRIVEAVRVPVWLAGGLNPDNVEEAIRWVGPFGVDVCTGLRDRHTLALDETRLVAFVEAVRRATV